MGSEAERSIAYSRAKQLTTVSRRIVECEVAETSTHDAEMDRRLRVFGMVRTELFGDLSELGFLQQAYDAMQEGKIQALMSPLKPE